MTSNVETLFLLQWDDWFGEYLSSSLNLGHSIKNMMSGTKQGSQPKYLLQQAEVWELKSNSNWHPFDENFGEDVKGQVYLENCRILYFLKIYFPITINFRNR